jgi:hypothetical protein
MQDCEISFHTFKVVINWRDLLENSFNASTAVAVINNGLFKLNLRIIK